MAFIKLWSRTSRGRRLNIKRVMFFPLIVYSVYLLVDSFMPLFMVGFVIWLLYNWTSKKNSGDKPIRFKGMKQ